LKTEKVRIYFVSSIQKFANGSDYIIFPWNGGFPSWENLNFLFYVKYQSHDLVCALPQQSLMRWYFGFNVPHSTMWLCYNKCVLELKWARLTQPPTNPISLKHVTCKVKIKDYKSTSSGAQYVALQKYFSHPSLVIYVFIFQPINWKLGQQIGWGVLIANHLDQSLWWANQKQWTPVRSYYYTLLCRCTTLLHLLPATEDSQNHFPELNRHILTFIFIHFYCAGLHTKNQGWCFKSQIVGLVLCGTRTRSKKHFVTKTTTLVPWPIHH
jgi:hypothetical protein